MTLQSFRLPKDTKKKNVSKTSNPKATLVATEKPFETAKLALDLLEVLLELVAKGNGNAVSDVGVAGLLASAACKGATDQMDINLLVAG